jgi:hypothetical protein
MPMELPTPDTLAATFLTVLAEELTPDQLAEVYRRNSSMPVYTRLGPCASHDFCDANMVMAEAFTRHGVEVDIDDDTQCALWGAAWALAFDEMKRRYVDVVVVLTVRCYRCGFTGTPLSDVKREGMEGHDLFCGSVTCTSCDEVFPVEIEAIRAAQHACLVALGED